MKVNVKSDAFEWMTEIQAAQEYGTRAAQAFARAMRLDARDYTLETRFPVEGEPAEVLAAASGLEWSIKVPFHRLIDEYIRDCCNLERPGCLEEFAILLENSAKKARRRLAKLRTVPAPGTASG